MNDDIPVSWKVVALGVFAGAAVGWFAMDIALRLAETFSRRRP